MSNKSVLVTGGCGFIGSHLVSRLLSAGWRVRVLDNCWRGDRRSVPDAHPNLEFVEGDVRDGDLVRRTCESIATVFHLAAVNGTRFFYECPDLVLDVGIRGTLAVLDAAIAAGVRRAIVASSAETYQNPRQVPTSESEPLAVPDVTDPRYSYGGSKIATELLALHYARPRGIEAVVFRPHNIYGPNMGTEHAIPQILLRIAKVSAGFQVKRIELPLLGSGEETRTYCHVNDAIEGILICGEKGVDGEVYHIGQDDPNEELTSAELARRIGTIVGVDVVSVPTGERSAQAQRRRPSIMKMRALGYAPNIRLDQGLGEVVDWYCRHMLAARPVTQIG